MRTITVTIDDEYEGLFRMCEAAGLTPTDVINTCLQMSEMFSDMIAESIIEAMISPDPAITRMN